MAIKIDWNKVDTYLMAGADGSEIASMFGIHYNTLSNKCKKEKKCDFCEYKQQKRAKGNSLLRAKQYDIAMQGDRSMLIWLGKNRLNQSDKKEVISENKNIQSFDLSKLTDAELKELEKLSATIRVDTNGEGQTDVS